MSNDELPSLAVTGSTGAVGGQVAGILAASGVPQRLLARTVAKVPSLDDAVAVPFTGYRDHDSSLAALRGTTTLLMVSAAESADRLDEHKAFVDAAAEAGVRHVVYTSFCAAAPDCTFTLGRDHYATEQHIRASGMDWTFLRDNFYLDFLPRHGRRGRRDPRPGRPGPALRGQPARRRRVRCRGAVPTGCPCRDEL